MKRSFTVAAVLILVFAFVCVVESCKKRDQLCLKKDKLVLPTEQYDYTAPVGANFKFAEEQVTNNGAELGRVLFYDRSLSANYTTSCGSCHIQGMGFADGQQFSKGFTENLTGRNTIAINNNGIRNFNTFNSAFLTTPQSNTGFFWDVRANQLEDMVLMPVANHVEMGFEEINKIVDRIKTIDYYKPLFNKAYGDEDVTMERIGTALAMFVRSIQTWKSKYDEGVKSNFTNFTAEELIGKQLFLGRCRCVSCHDTPTFSPNYNQVANIGLDMNYKDKGASNFFNNRFTPFAADPKQEGFVQMEGYFKIPGLRNIEVTAPYMHDGRFNTLEEVVEHYNSGMKNHPQLNWEFKTKVDESTGDFARPFSPFDLSGALKEPRKLNLTAAEKKALVAFLRTLTDQKFLFDPKYSSPFVAVD